MRLRLALAATAAALVAAPFAPASHAGVCNDRDFPEVCAALERACQSTEVTRTVCRQFG